jgi:hypothetical protein
VLTPRTFQENLTYEDEGYGTLFYIETSDDNVILAGGDW